MLRDLCAPVALREASRSSQVPSAEAYTTEQWPYHRAVAERCCAGSTGQEVAMHVAIGLAEEWNQFDYFSVPDTQRARELPER